ncbi:hypothetical protein GGS21DRAFT_543591 [Xylaria nigripes]|nr:hypothetical protein GGS21DRAFT_543591 [Xylaria nigripes]
MPRKMDSESAERIARARGRRDSFSKRAQMSVRNQEAEEADKAANKDAGGSSTGNTSESKQSEKGDDGKGDDGKGK